MWPYLPKGRDALEELRKAIRVLRHQCGRYGRKEGEHAAD